MALGQIIDDTIQAIADSRALLDAHGPAPLAGQAKLDFEAACDSASSSAADALADSYFDSYRPGTVQTGTNGDRLGWWEEMTDYVDGVVANPTSLPAARQTAADNLASMADATRLAELKSEYT